MCDERYLPLLMIRYQYRRSRQIPLPQMLQCRVSLAQWKEFRGHLNGHLGREGELVALLQAAPQGSARRAGNGGPAQPASVSAQLATGKGGGPAATAPTGQTKTPQAAPRGRAAPPARSGKPQGNGKGGKSQPQAQRGKGAPTKKK